MYTAVHSCCVNETLQLSRYQHICGLIQIRYENMLAENEKINYDVHLFPSTHAKCLSTKSQTGDGSPPYFAILNEFWPN